MNSVRLNTSHAMGSDSEFHVGPHSMIIGADQKMTQTLSQDGSNGEPYVNHLPGHWRRVDSMILDIDVNFLKPQSDRVTPKGGRAVRKSIIILRPAGRLRLRSTKQCQPRFSPPRSTSDSVLGARLTSPTSSYPQCGINSGDTWKNPKTNPK